MPRAAFPALVAVVALTSATAMATVAESAAAPAAGKPEVVIDGKGHGHGVGMASDGNYAMGAAGASTSAILGTFFPGTSIVRRSGLVRVTLLDRPTPDAVVSFPSGGEVRDAPSGAQSPGFPIAVKPGGSVRLAFGGGRYHAFPLAGASAAAVTPGSTPAPAGAQPSTAPPPPPASEPVSGRPLVAVPVAGSTVVVPTLGRRYRGNIQAVAGGGGLQLVNEIDVEQYLQGMGEVVAPGWPTASLRAQAIAARTNALRAMTSGGSICPTDHCQVYVGQSLEYAAMNKAVADTKGQVLVYGGALADAVYSSNGGGVTATPQEGFGSAGGPPYLRATPYRTNDPDPWTVRLSLADLAARVGVPGHPADARVSRAGPSGRALEVTFSGDGGDRTVDGQRFAAALQLRSTLFTIRVEAAPAPQAAIPAAPPDAAAAPAPAEPGPGVPSPGHLVLAAGPSSGSMGRTPWIALAILVLVATGAATRVFRARTTP